MRRNFSEEGLFSDRKLTASPNLNIWLLKITVVVIFQYSLLCEVTFKITDDLKIGKIASRCVDKLRTYLAGINSEVEGCDGLNSAMVKRWPQKIDTALPTEGEVPRRP